MKPLPPFLFLAALLAGGATGCQGSTGPTGPSGATGPTGGGYYTSRDAVYCNTNAYPYGATATSITASCSTTLDLPLTGACDLATGGYVYPPALVTNQPGWWAGSNATHPAQWTCAWKDSSGAWSSPQYANATICCITVPPP